MESSAFASMGEARRIAHKIAMATGRDAVEIFEEIKDMSRAELERYAGPRFYTNVQAKRLSDGAR